MWTKDDIRILLVDDMTDHPIVMARISTPDGEVTVMAEANEVDKCLILRNFHIHGENIRPRQFGYARLRGLDQTNRNTRPRRHTAERCLSAAANIGVNYGQDTITHDCINAILSPGKRGQAP